MKKSTFLGISLPSFRKTADLSLSGQISGVHVDRGGKHQAPLIIKQLNLSPVIKRKRDLTDWKRARDSAYNGNRKLLYDLYWDCLSKDDFLVALFDKRRLPILNTPVVFVDAKGVENRQLTGLLESAYFTLLLEEIVNSELFGFSLMELHWPKPDESFNKGITTLIPREHVKPELGMVVKEPYDEKGISYFDEPYNSTVIAVGGVNNLGACLQASKLSIRAENNQGDWGESNESYGMPDRHVKVDNEDEREKIKQQIEKSGAGTTIISDKEVDIIYGSSSNNGSSGGSFDTFDKRMMERMAIRVLGQTMTTLDSNHAGYAQAKIHGQVEEELNRKDRLLVMRTLNTQVLPYLNRLGWKLEGSFAFKDDDVLSLEEHLTIDRGLHQMGLPLSKSEFYKRYRRALPENTDDVLTQIPLKS